MEVIFSKEDFKLCNLPVPKGYPYSQTHAGVAYSEQGIGGCHWFVVSSPYPNPKRNVLERGFRFLSRKILGIKYKPSDWYENPMLYFGDTISEPPTVFAPYHYNPLMVTPDDVYGLGAFNSDPDIYIKDNTIFVLNRSVTRRKTEQGVLEYLTSIFLIQLSFKENEFETLPPVHLFDYENVNASPSLVYYKNKYRIFSLVTSSYNTGEPCEYAEMRESSSIEGPYDTVSRIHIKTNRYQPWHFSVFEYNGTLYSIVSCIKDQERQRCYQMLGQFSDDLRELKVYQLPLTDMRSYRGDAVVLPDGTFVLYTSIIEPFPGSFSVDGRDILTVSKSFESILNELKEYEKKSIGL